MKDGATLRDHLRMVEKMTHKPSPELYGPELPKCVSYIWRLFIDVNSGRTNNGYGPNPLSFQELKSWSKLMKIKLNPWEVSLIKKIDMIFMSYQSKKAE